MLRTSILAAATAVCLGLATTPAQAAIYSFAYTDTTGTGDDYSGQLTVTGSVVTAISGTSALYGAITDLLPPGTSFGAAPSDNTFSPTAPFFTVGGLTFATDTFGVNMFAAVGDVFVTTSQGTSSMGTFAARLVPRPFEVPEPGALALAAAGLAALGTIRNRRRVV